MAHAELSKNFSVNYQPMKEVPVWDPLLRLFHWLLAASFATAYLSADEIFSVHKFAGITIACLLSFRLVWGLIGPKYARFSNFVVSPSQIVQYLRDMRMGKEKRYLGHNPAGAAMILALLAGLTGAASTGLLMYSGFIPRNELGIIPDIHELCANMVLLLVPIHLLGVIVASKRHRENLAKSMISGKKRQQD